MMNKKLSIGILSVIACGCFGAGVAILTPTVSAAADAAELPTVQSVYADFDMRSTTNTTDEAYYRSDLSYYASGNATVNSYGRYFDCNNFGVWEIPFTEESYEKVQVDCSIKTVWKIYVSVDESNCDDINSLTWTLGAEYTDDNNRYVEFQNVKSDVTAILDASTASEKSIYVKICDPSTDAGNGPQIRHMRVYVDKFPDITLSADDTGSVPVGSDVSVFDAVNLKIDGITGVEATSVSATIEDETILSYADGKFTGLQAGITSVALSYGGKMVECDVTVGGFLIENDYQATSAMETAIFRSDISGSGVNSAPARYFDKANVGIWELPLPQADFSLATLSMTMSAFWNLEIGIGEPNSTDLTNIAMLNVSSNLSARAERTVVRLVLSELLTGDLNGKCLYIRVSDPTVDDGNGPQVFKLVTLFRYERDPKAYDLTLPENMSIGVGERLRIPTMVESEPNAKYELVYTANNEEIFNIEDGFVVGKKQGTASVTAKLLDSLGEVVAVKNFAIMVNGYALKESFSIFDGKEIPYMDGTYSGYWREDLTTRRVNNPDKSMLDMLDYNRETGLWYRYFDCEATGVWEFPFTGEAFSKLKLHVNLYVWYKIEIAIANTATYDAVNCEWDSAVIENWITVAEGYQAELAELIVDVSEYLPEDVTGKGLYVRISDPSKNDGWGPKVNGLGVTYICEQLPANFFEVSLETENSKMFLLETERKKANVTVTADEGVEYTLVYAIADESIATVSDTGTVKGVRAGTTKLTISAIFRDGTVLAVDEMEITVTAIGSEVPNEAPETNINSGCAGSIDGALGLVGCLGACSLFLIKKRKENEKK